MLERLNKGAPLTYRRFIDPDSVLVQAMGSFIFIDTIEALKAHIALLDAFYPLAELNYVDTNVLEGAPREPG